MNGMLCYGFWVDGLLDAVSERFFLALLIFCVLSPVKRPGQIEKKFLSKDRDNAM